jgi:hypothetical protein
LSSRFLNPSNDGNGGSSLGNYYHSSVSGGSLLSKPTEKDFATRGHIKTGVVIPFEHGEVEQMVGATAAMEECGEEGVAGVSRGRLGASDVKFD